MQMKKEIMNSLKDETEYVDETGVNRYKKARTKYYELVDLLNEMK